MANNQILTYPELAQVQLATGEVSFIGGVWKLTPSGYIPSAAALTALSPLVPVADRLAYYTGATTAALTTFTAYGRSLVAAADAAAAKILLSLTKADVGLGNVVDGLQVLKAGDTMTGTLTFRAGAAGAGTAPAKFQSGALMTAPEAGAVEFLTDKLYATITTGTARKEIALVDAPLTSGRIPFTTTNGRIADWTGLTINLATGDITNTVNFSSARLGVGTTWPSGNTRLNVGTGLGNFGGSNAVAHFVDSSLNATVNYQNTNASGVTAFDMFNSNGVKAATFGFSNPSAGYANELWISTRAAYDLWFGTNTTERLRITSTGAVQVANSLAVGSGTAITQVKVYTPTLTPAAVAANTSAEQTFTVTGLATSDTITVNGPAPTAGTGIVGVRVSAADTLAILFGNFTAGPLTPAAGVFRILATRS